MGTKKKGQALIELAVFGSIFLMIVGAMLSYGLRYNYMQQAHQLAYRRAMKIASDPGRGSGSYTLMTDKHIPDPVDPYAIGSTMPIIASASVTRSAQLDAVPQLNDLKDDLPSMVVDVQQSQHNGVTAPLRRLVYTSAGFRYEYPSSGQTFSDDQINKYKLLYGEAVVKNGGVRITDSCSGENVDFNACYEQAARLVDNDMCYKYCADVNSSSGVNCGTLCSDAVLLNPPNQLDKRYDPSIGGPWYADSYVKNDPDPTHPAAWYTFKVLDQLFASLGSKSMGFQPSQDMTQVRNTSMHRTETPGSVVTEERVGWSDTTHKDFTYNNNLDAASGDEIVRPTANEYTGQVATNKYTSEVGGNYSETWTTGK